MSLHCKNCAACEKHFHDAPISETLGFCLRFKENVKLQGETGTENCFTLSHPDYWKKLVTDKDRSDRARFFKNYKKAKNLKLELQAERDQLKLF